MAWYWIVLIIFGGLFALTFAIYITNGDMKLVEKIYNKVIDFHDKQEKEETL